MADQKQSYKPREGALWCVHVCGLDDLHPARDYEEAQKHAQSLNMAIARQLPTPFDPIMYARPEEWPYTSEAHAEALAKAIREHGESYPWNPQWRRK